MTSVFFGVRRVPAPEVPSLLSSRLLFALLSDPSSRADMLSDLHQSFSPVRCAAREVRHFRGGLCSVALRRGSSWCLRGMVGFWVLEQIFLIFRSVSGLSTVAEEYGLSPSRLR